MTVQIEPISSISLKDACISKLEGLILSGALEAGERLPSERDLATQLGVSRPVLHQAIVALDAKGLVQIEPRRGVFICDYRREGSIPLYTTLMAHSDGSYMPELLSSMMAARILIETETAKLAAQHRSQTALSELRTLLEQGVQINNWEVSEMVAYDFRFHQSVAIASGNLMYPMMINSLKNVHTNLAGSFYRTYAGRPVITEVFAYQAKLVDAIEQLDVQLAGEIMAAMLVHGEECLLRILPQD
jgi:DNA-binding FadR family transcriptional regulator